MTLDAFHHNLFASNPQQLWQNKENMKKYIYLTALVTYKDDNFWAVLWNRACGRVINYNSRPRGSKWVGSRVVNLKGHKPTQRDALPFSSHGIKSQPGTRCGNGKRFIYKPAGIALLGSVYFNERALARMRQKSEVTAPKAHDFLRASCDISKRETPISQSIPDPLSPPISQHGDSSCSISESEGQRI